MKYLLAEANYARQLADNTRELLAYSKALGGLTERRAARAEFLAELAQAGRINLAPKTGEDPKKLYSVDGSGVAHINIIGQLTPVAEQDICGGYTASALTEYGYIIAATQAAEADQQVQSIDYHVNSPGGYISGLDEAAQVMAMAGVPTRAVVGDMAASAAYWLASQTDRIVASGPGSRIGSIGVIAEEYNADRALAAEGIDHNVYTSTDAPLKHADTSTPEGKAQITADLDQLHAIFRDRVAQGRGVTVEKVNADFGKGAVMTAQAALAAGMIDEIQGVSIARPRSEMEKKPAVSGAAGDPAIKTKGSKKMTLEQLKAENPEAYQAALAEGRALGIKAERDRVSELSAWKEGHNDAVHAIVEESISNGKAFADVHAQLSAAAARGPKAKANDTPPGVLSAEVPKPAQLADEDVQAAEMFGMSLDDYKKYATTEGGR